MSFLIAQAFAADDKAAAVVAPAAPAATTPAAAAPVIGGLEGFMGNFGLILVMFVLFYFLLIRPQQKRLKAQQDMLNALKKGDRVLTAGGLVGSVVSVDEKSGEVEIDLGKGQIVTALRYTISTKLDPK